MEKKRETKTTLLKAEECNQRSWYLLDASGKTLGHLCSEISKILRGKHKVSFTPHVNCGDGVVVINAEQVKLTGAKKVQKVYRYYTGHIGGLREIPFENMLYKKPEYIIMHAVQGMMPKTRLGKQQLKSLRVFKGEAEGVMSAQKPIKVEI